MARKQHGAAAPAATGTTPQDHDDRASQSKKASERPSVNLVGHDEAMSFFHGLMCYGEIHEIRVPRRWVGYFNDPEKAARCAVAISKANRDSQDPASGIYVTLNPVDPELAGDRLNAKPEKSGSAAKSLRQ